MACHDHPRTAASHGRIYLLLAALALLVVAASGCSDDAIESAFVVCPPDAECPAGVAGVTKSSYAKWAERWWQWAVSTPEDRNPLADTDGSDCAEGQPEPTAGEPPIWFLAGTLGGGTVVRSCEVPSNRSLFFPIANFTSHPCFANENCEGRGLSEPCEGQPNTVEWVEEDFAGFSIYDVITESQLILDGKRYGTTDSLRAETDVYEFTGVASEDIAAIACTSGTRYAKANGLWGFLEPLPARAEPYVVQFTIDTSVGFSLDVTYNLTIVAPTDAGAPPDAGVADAAAADSTTPADAEIADDAAEADGGESDA